MRRFSRIFSKKLLFSKLFLLTCLVLLIFLLVSLSQEFSRRYYLEQQVKSFKKEIAELEAQNQEFSELMEYFQTQTFTEKEARLKMGLKKPGEKVLVINQPQHLLEREEERQKEIEQFSNPQKWWHYFFGTINHS